MKYKLLGEEVKGRGVIETILDNRGIPKDDDYRKRFLYPTDKELFPPELLGADTMERAASLLEETIKKEGRVLVLQDCDCDGFCSTALLVNFLYDMAPEWTMDKVDIFSHEDKTHGLSDAMDYILPKDYKIVFCPDASSSEWEFHNKLAENGIACIVTDHHTSLSEDIEKSKGIIINNQICDYPNKALCGTAITWKFCKYFEETRRTTNFSDKYYDLISLAEITDMMDYRELETKYIIDKGTKEIYNPFLQAMVEKNRYSIGPEVNSIAWGFYVGPYINAMTRSGTLEEKKIVTDALLKYKAYKLIPSTKRGHSAEEVEPLVEQAIRVASQVKYRQNKTQTEAMEYLEERIEADNMLDNKVLLFKIEPGEVPKNLAGLAANKLAAKYLRPTLVLTKGVDEEEECYIGSMRGCAQTGVNDFKSLCEETGHVRWVRGHKSAAGCCIKASEIDEYISAINESLKDVNSESVYAVDFIFKRIPSISDISEITKWKDLWGMNFPDVKIVLEDVLIIPSMVNVYRKVTNTIKITLSNGLILMKFKASSAEADMFEKKNITINLVGSCNINEFNGVVTQQIFIDDYEKIENPKWVF